MPLKLWGNPEVVQAYRCFLFDFRKRFFVRINFKAGKVKNMSNNILFQSKDFEKNVRNHNHLILSMDLEYSWWLNPFYGCCKHITIKHAFQGVWIKGTGERGELLSRNSLPWFTGGKL